MFSGSLILLLPGLSPLLVSLLSLLSVQVMEKFLIYG